MSRSVLVSSISLELLHYLVFISWDPETSGFLSSEVLVECDGYNCEESDSSVYSMMEPNSTTTVQRENVCRFSLRLYVLSPGFLFFP